MTSECCGFSYNIEGNSRKLKVTCNKCRADVTREYQRKIIFNHNLKVS